MSIVRFQKVVCWVVLAFACLGNALAQVPGEPLRVPLKFACRADVVIDYRNGPVRISLLGQTAQTSTTNNLANNSPVRTVYLEPGKIYKGSYAAPNDRAWAGAFFAAPPGYAVYIKGKKRTDLGISGHVPNGQFEIKVVNEANFDGPVGEATSFIGGRILWQVSVGKKRSQEHAGNLMFSFDGVTDDQWDDAVSPVGLYFETDSTESVSQNKILVLSKPLGGKSVLRQIYAPQAVIDIITREHDETMPEKAYGIRFFHPSQASHIPSTVSGSSAPVTFTGHPFVEYEIQNIDAEDGSASSNAARTIQITKTRRSASTSVVLADAVVSTTVLRRTIVNERFVWQIADWWSGADQKGRTVVIHTVNAEATEETVGTYLIESTTSDWTTATPQSGLKLAAREVRGYTRLGDLLVENGHWRAISSVRIESEQEAPALTAASHTNLLYYDNPTVSPPADAQTASRGFIYGKIDSSGAWEYYGYSESADIFSIGRIAKIFRPFLDQADPFPAGSTAANRVGPDWTNGTITELTYSKDEGGMKTRLASKITKINGKVVEKETRAYSSVDSHTNLLRTTIRNHPNPGSSVTAEANAYVETVSLDYRQTVTNGLHTGRPYSLTTAAGQRTSYIRQYVKRGSTANTFSNDSAGKLVRMGKIEGTVDSVPANPQTGAGASVQLTAFAGFDINNIHVVEGISTLDLEIYDEYCNLIRTESSVWKRSSSTSGTWELLQATDYTYNLDHTLAQRQTTGADPHSFSISFGRVDSEMAPDGSVVSYAYDQAGRVTTVTKSGTTNPFTPTLTTTYTYDGAGRVVSEVVSGADSTEEIATYRLYDLAGRVRAEIAPGGFATITTYEPELRQITASAPFKPTVAFSAAAPALPEILPGTPITTRTHYRDGRPHTEQTTGFPADTHTYTVLGNGRLLTKVENGPASAGRYVETVTDGLGRTVSIARPRPLSGQMGTPRISGRHVEVNDFNSNGQLVRVSRGSGPGTDGLPAGAVGLAATLYVYDAFGRPYRTGLDLNGNGVLDLAGPDRITESDERMQLIGGHWWLRKEGFAYLHEGAATRVSTGHSLTRLTGLSLALAAETKTVDAEGNESTATSVVTPASRTVTVTRSAAGLSASATEIVVNGYAISRTTPDGLTYTTEYDHLGRPWKSTAPRVGASETEYEPGTPGTVLAVKDTRKHTVATYIYDAWGRVITSTDALGKATHTTYTPRGQVHRVWGPAAMPVEYGYDDYGARTTLKTFQGGFGWDGTSWPSDTGPASTTTWDYDLATGLLMAKRDALTQGNSTRGYVAYEYDALGRVKHRRWGRSLASPSTQRVTTTHHYASGSGDLTAKTYNDGTPNLFYAYTRTGQVKTITDSTGTRTFAYDASKPWRLQTETLADGHVFTQLYEGPGAAALPGTVLVPGRARGFRFGTAAAPASVTEQILGINGQGRLVAISSSRPAAGGHPAFNQIFRYTYRPDAPLLSGLAAEGTAFSVSRTYEDKRDLLTGIETKWGLDVRVRHRYVSDDIGRRRHAFQDGSAFGDYGLGAEEGVRHDYDYDDRGQLQTAKASFDQAPSGLGAPAGSGARSLPNRRYGYAYDHAGNRTGSVFDHQGASAPPQTAFYNAANELVSRSPGPVAVHGTADANTQVAIEDISENAQTGQIETKAETVEKVDASNYWQKQLEFIPSAEEWRRHARGFFVGAYRAGQANQQSRFAFFQGRGETMLYDEDGNLTRDDKWDYVWDAENRLIRQTTRPYSFATTSSPAVFDAPTRYDIHYRYDYRGRRVSKRVVTLDATGLPVDQREHHYYYDGWNMVAEAELDDTTTLPVFKRTYTWGLDLAGSLTASGGVGALLQIADHDDGQRYFPGYDGNGNVSALIGAASGAVAASYEYSPFGESLRSVAGGIAAANPFRFSTKFNDNETGLVYYGMRYYDPEKGRFINRDPIEERGGLNLYGFCGNDSINGIDVHGMFLKKWWKKLRKWLGKHKWVSLALGVGLAVLGGWAVAGMVKQSLLAGATANMGFGTAYATVNLAGQAALTSLGSSVMYAAGGAAGGFIGGAYSAAVSGQNPLKGGLIGAVVGGISGGFLHGLENIGTRVAGHAVLGGVASVAHGGKFGPGALASGLTVGLGVGNFSRNPLLNTFASAAVGGGISRVTGGDFATGAVTAGLQVAFNDNAERIFRDPSTMPTRASVFSCMDCHGLPWQQRAAIGLPMDQPWFNAAGYEPWSKVFGGSLLAGSAFAGAVVLGGPTAMAASNAFADGFSALGTYTVSASTNLAYVGSAGTAAGGMLQLQGRFDFGQALQATGALSARITPLYYRTTPYLNGFGNFVSGVGGDFIPYSRSAAAGGIYDTVFKEKIE